ncbi:hypothetical protein ACFLUZ_05715 [Chloroflexota bacterium]
MNIQVTRIYTGPDNQSHFEDMPIPLEENLVTKRRSKLMKATGILFQETVSNYESDWHNAPRRQFVITIGGEGEVEIGDGSKRRFKAGDIVLNEDTTGQGHISRSVNGQSWQAVWVPLD